MKVTIHLAMEAVITRVNEKLGRNDVNRAVRECRLPLASLWSRRRWATMRRDTLVLCLYKDLTLSSYASLEAIVPSSRRGRHKSFHHNVLLARKALGDWAQGILDERPTMRQISLLSVAAMHRNPHFRWTVHIWVDSVDFRFSGSPKGRGKDPWWSYKTKSLARRYLVFADGSGRVLLVLGPFSPKVQFFTQLLGLFLFASSTTHI